MKWNQDESLLLLYTWLHLLPAGHLVYHVCFVEVYCFCQLEDITLFQPGSYRYMKDSDYYYDWKKL